ncbi:DMT family transporter [Streptomyces purpureus]|uniref:DMT family transporter n=1 Tax=Streptomyces purpureus TaxID=1951 RepID=UPI003787F9EA
MNGIVVAVLLSLVSAAGYALAAVIQSRLSGSMRALLARPLWWWAVGLNAAGALAHVGALHYGPLTLVQPLGALTLVAALPLAARRERRRVTRAEWRGALSTLAGLLGLIAVTGPATPGDALSLPEAMAVAAATALLIAALARGRHGLGQATASGVASAAASALTQTLTSSLALRQPGGAALWWQTAVLAVVISAFAAGGLVLSQSAYRVGLAAPLAVVNLANPAAAAVIGVSLLGETFRAGAWGWLIAAVSAALAARGALLLTLPTTPTGPRPTSAPPQRAEPAAAPAR